MHPSSKIYITDYYNEKLEMQNFWEINHLNDLNIANMHNGYGNVLACDGHVTAVKLYGVPPLGVRQAMPSKYCYFPKDATNYTL